MTFEALHQELVKSMKDKNRVRKNVIADMITCAKNMAIEQGCKDNISEEIVNAAILKSKKICQEQIVTCPQQRPDILEGYLLCMGYIEELAPKMMDYVQVQAVVARIGEVNKNKTVLSKGVMMRAAMAELKGKADGKLVNQAVTEYLAGGE
ncbi:MAG: GatB/YqeY domain-containing protein [Acetobacter sp.]|nr:GatB/YqeY domain-containing protein [Acetobacter sp.]